MGYQRSTVKLKFPEGNEFAGLEVSLKRVSIGKLEDMEMLIERAESKLSAREAIHLSIEMAEFLAPSLLGWTFNDSDGSAIPPTLDGIKANVDLDMMLAIFLGWIDAVSGVSEDLKEKSSNGETPLPPEEMQLSLANWQELEKSLISANDSDVSPVN